MNARLLSDIDFVFSLLSIQYQMLIRSTNRSIQIVCAVAQICVKMKCTFSSKNLIQIQIQIENESTQLARMKYSTAKRWWQFELYINILQAVVSHNLISHISNE